VLLVAGLVGAGERADGGSPAPAAGEPAKISVICDPGRTRTEINIPARRSRLVWSDLLRGLTRADGYDDRALEGVLPAWSIDLRGRAGRRAVRLVNSGLIPGVTVHAAEGEGEPGGDRLVIQIDHARRLELQRRWSSRVRQWLPPTPSRYGLFPDPGWERSSAERPMVVMIAGLNAWPEEANRLLHRVRHEGYACAYFRYPNDQPIDQSAEFLADELRALANRHPERTITLVTHSMGALVARAAIEVPERDPGNVGQLIMIAPPNHGSALARYALGLDIWEYIRSAERRKQGGWSPRPCIEDGLGEAVVDLRPNSVFLDRLNAHGRHPRVRYTIFLGNAGGLQPDQLALLRSRTARAAEHGRLAQFLGGKIQGVLGDLDELVAGKGDGLVSLERGQLEGVDDVLVLPFVHASVLEDGVSGDVDRLPRELLQRLASGSRR